MQRQTHPEWNAQPGRSVSQSEWIEPVFFGRHVVARTGRGQLAEALSHRDVEVSICGTDKKIILFHSGTPPADFVYLIIGHESLGEVIEMGPEVRADRSGDLVVVAARCPCPHEHCRACPMEYQDFRFTDDFTERGIKEARGFMAELVADEERSLNVLPSNLHDVAVLTETLTVAEKVMSQVWYIQQLFPWIDPDTLAAMRARGLMVLVLGTRLIGQPGTMSPVAADFEMYVYSHSKAPNLKACLVEAIGVTYFSTETTPVEQLASRVGTIDLVFDATAPSQTSFDVMRVLGTNAIFVFGGLPDHSTPIEVDTALLIRNHVVKNQAILGSVNAHGSDSKAAIRDLRLFKQCRRQKLYWLFTEYDHIEHDAQAFAR